MIMQRRSQEYLFYAGMPFPEMYFVGVGVQYAKEIDGTLGTAKYEVFCAGEQSFPDFQFQALGCRVG